MLTQNNNSKYKPVFLKHLETFNINVENNDMIRFSVLKGTIHKSKQDGCDTTEDLNTRVETAGILINVEINMRLQPNLSY